MSEQVKYGSVEYFLKAAGKSARVVAAVIMAGIGGLGWTYRLAMSGVESGLEAAKKLTGFKGSEG